jgi:hypothetical protein
VSHFLPPGASVCFFPVHISLIQNKKGKKKASPIREAVRFRISLISQNLPQRLLQELAPSLIDHEVAGFHRACPSTTLDKKYLINRWTHFTMK